MAKDRIRVDELAGLQYPGDFETFYEALPQHLQKPFGDYGLSYKPGLNSQGKIEIESPDGWAGDIPKRQRANWSDADYTAIDDAAQKWARDMEKRCNKAAESWDEVY